MRSEILAAASAALVCLAGASGAEAQVILSLEGECPGRLTIEWRGSNSDRRAALAFSRAEGQFLLPAGPCQGTLLGLSSSHGFRDVRVFRTGPEGRGRLTGQANLAACGGYLQMIVADGRPCSTSNVVQIPE